MAQLDGHCRLRHTSVASASSIGFVVPTPE